MICLLHFSPSWFRGRNLNLVYEKVTVLQLTYKSKRQQLNNGYTPKQKSGYTATCHEGGQIEQFH